MVTDLTTQKFKDALRRFIARRGVPNNVFSDNATNFEGVANQLKLNHKEWLEFAAHERIDWQFSPPRAPHHNGMAEAAVKSAKSLLRNVTKGVVLTIEDYLTLFTQVEGILNSRPLCYKNLPDQGKEVITPSHLLVGGSLLHSPQLDSEYDLPLSRRNELLSNQIKGFWNVWSKSYLNQMQQRSKWQKKTENLAVGVIVFVTSEARKPFDWPLGIVEEVFTAPDGLVRSANVRFKNKIQKRAVTSLRVGLPHESELISKV